MFLQSTGRAGPGSGSWSVSSYINLAGLEWAAATGFFYFLAAWVSLPLTTSEGVAQFWPAAGVAAGALLAAGDSARLSISIAIAAASFLANWLDGRSASSCLAFALGNTGEALTVAVLAGRWLERPFKLDRLKSVIGLFAAAALGTAIWQAVTAAAYSLVTPAAARFGHVWSLLVWANLTGIVMVAPVLAGIAAEVRKPPSLGLMIEGSAVLMIHALASAHAFGLLPFEYGRWMMIAPLSSQLPLLLWLAVRCGPLFAALGTLVLGVAMVLSSFSNQHSYFANNAFSMEERLLAMHFAMLAVAFVALATAALIAERRNAEMAARHSETRLKLSLDAGNFGTWEFEPASDTFQASGSALTCFGLPMRLPAPFPAVLSTLHPGDRQLFEAQFLRVSGEGGDFDSECRVLRPDGSVRWLHVMGGATEDALGARRIAGAVRDITEHKSIASLKESAEQLRLFVEQAPVAIAMFDRQMRYLSASQRWTASYGLSRRGLIGSSVYAAAQEFPDAWKEVHQRAMSGEVMSGDQDPAVLADGQTHWLRWEARPWRMPNGSIGGIVIFTDDVTARVQAERALRESRQDLDRAQAVARTGSWRVDVNRNALTGSAETYRMFGIPSGTVLTFESFLEAVHPDDRQRLDREWKAALAGGAASGLEFRIVANGRTKWLLARSELEYEASGKFIGGFGTVQDITDKKLAEEELLRLQRLTQLISDRAADAIFLTDENGFITYANPEAERLFEFESKEMLGHQLHDLLHHHHADGTPFPREDWRLAKIQDAGATVRNHEDVFFRKDLSPVDVSCSFAPLEQESNRSGGVFVVRDISAEKSARAALRESEERLRLSNEAAGIGTLTLDLAANRIYYSLELAAILGFPGLRTARIDDAFARVHREDVGRVRAQYEAALSGAGGEQIKVDFRFVRPGGEIRWMTWIGRVEFRDGPKGRTPFRVAGACVDISDRKRAEEATAQLAAIVTSSSDAIVGKGLDGIIWSWNEAAAVLFGYSSEEIVGQSIRRLIPPGRETEEDSILARVAAGKVVEHYETIRLHKSGKLLDISLTVSPIRNAAGKITGASKIARDISGPKRAAEALRESEERFRAIVGTAVDAIIVIDEDAQIHSINPASERMFGYAQSEIAGKNISLLMPEPVRSEHHEYIKAYCQSGIKTVIGKTREMQHQRKDGSLFPADLTVAEWQVGGKRHFTGVIRDITERKRNEEKVQLLLREVNHRAKNMLALVQAIASRTAAPDHAEFMKRFSERLSALAASQDLLVGSGWQGVETGALVHSQLSHFKSLIDDRIKLKGQPTKLSAPAAQTIGMALHELATNAGKYGALSCGTGSIEIEWRLFQAEDRGERFEMIWAEHGGPAVSPPARSGFGHTVIETIPRMELDAGVTLDYAPEGLRWRLDCPSKSVLEMQHNGDGAGVPLQ